MKNQIFVVALLLGVFFSIPTFADTVEWQSTAMTCVPTSQTIEENKYVTTAGRIKFKTGKFGLISFLCPVSKPMPAGKYTLRGKIKTPAPDLFGIAIQLRRAHNVTGDVATVLNVSGVQQGNITKNFRSTDSARKQVKFDFIEYTYWVQISYKRNSANSDSLSVLSVQLLR